MCIPCLSCLPCFALGWCGLKTSKFVEPKKPAEPVESALATELKLKIGVRPAGRPPTTRACGASACSLGQRGTVSWTGLMGGELPMAGQGTRELPFLLLPDVLLGFYAAACCCS